MHILAIGGNGFIGSHFVNAAVTAGHEVSVLSRKPSPLWRHDKPFRHLPGGVEALVAHPEWLVGVDAVCHGGWSTVPKTAAADPISDVQENVIGIIKVLELIKTATSVKQLLFLSSGGAVYGAVESLEPIKEDQSLEPIGAYGIGKLAAEKYCLAFARDQGLPVTIIRPANPYGVGQSTSGVLGVVSTFLHHALEGTPATIYGDGSIVRDFMDVCDLANLMVMALEQSVPGIYNCGSGTGSSLTEIIDAIQRESGRTLVVNRMPDRPYDPPRIVLDIMRAQRTFGWTPKVSLREGIAALIASL